MPLEEKRKFYRCGDYTMLNQVETWAKYAEREYLSVAFYAMLTFINHFIFYKRVRPFFNNNA